MLNLTCKLVLTACPENITVSPKIGEYKQRGDQLTCTADGDAEPTYEWTSDGIVLHVGPTYIVNSTGFNVLTCTARTSLTGIACGIVRASVNFTVACMTCLSHLYYQ